LKIGAIARKYTISKIATLEMSCGCGFLFVAGVEPALDSKDGPASSEVAALSYEQGRYILTT
jgi:hypothetical protein